MNSESQITSGFNSSVIFLITSGACIKGDIFMHITAGCDFTFPPGVSFYEILKYLQNQPMWWIYVWIQSPEYLKIFRNLGHTSHFIILPIIYVLSKQCDSILNYMTFKLGKSLNLNGWVGRWGEWVILP